MSQTFEELKHKSVAQPREIAKAEEANHEELKGYTQLNKDHLITVLCKAPGIAMHVHHEARGIDKVALKTKLKELKQQRHEAVAAHDHAKLKVIRHSIHTFKHRSRAAIF
jgi:hypothetical protein